MIMNPEPDEDLNKMEGVKQITDEDIVYSTLLESHPNLESLVYKFDLCRVQTEDRFDKPEKRMAIKSIPPILTTEEYTLHINMTIDRILNSEENCEDNEIKGAKMKKTRRSKKKAAYKFKQMVRAMVAPRKSLADPNYFIDSTLRGNLLR